MNIYICFVEKSKEESAVLLAQKKKISVVIVNYKSWGHLDACLTSLETVKSAFFDLDVIVVDNDSASDKRNAFIQKFKKVTFAENTGNNGFANGCNFGASLGKGDFFLFLNPDTIVSEAALRAMLLEAVENKNYGIVSCIQINKSGGKEKIMRFFPTIKTIFGLFRALYRTRNKKELAEKFDTKKRIVFPDWVSGSVVFMSKSWFEKVGGWNEDYWMYYEDVSISKKVSDKGGKVALLREVKIVHNHGGASRINIKTSAITRSQVLISKHVYVHNNFSGILKYGTQTILVLHVLLTKLIGAIIGALFFFIPKMRTYVLLYRDLLRHYSSCIRYGTWLSVKSMNHPLKSIEGKQDQGDIRIGFDAKRIYHNKTGLGNYSRDLVCLLSKIHPNNSYFLYNPKEKKIDRLSNKENLIEVLPTSRFWKRFSSVWRQGPMLKQLLADRVQIFHGLSGEIPKGLRATNIKAVVTIHDLIFMRYPKLYSYTDRKIHYKKFLHAVHRADQVIAISEQTKKDVVTFLKVKPSKIKVIYQGCHHFFKTALPENFKEEVRKKFNLPNQYILNVGTIETRKNLLLAVKAVKDIDTVLVVVGGETPYYNEVKEYIDTENIQDKIVFLSDVALKELVAVYQMASIFVYPSIFEGFGIPIIEALYSKIPVITSQGGCFPEAGGPNSLYIDPTDEHELKDKIVAVLNNADVRNSMIEKGHEFVQKFNDDVIAKEMMQVYRDLL